MSIIKTEAKAHFYGAYHWAKRIYRQARRVRWVQRLIKLIRMVPPWVWCRVAMGLLSRLLDLYTN